MKKINLTFEVPREILLNANVSYHRFVKGDRAKKLRALASQTDVTETFNRFKVTVEVFPPTRRRLDPPNLSPTVILASRYPFGPIYNLTQSSTLYSTTLTIIGIKVLIN